MQIPPEKPKHRQIGPPVTINGYLVQAVDGEATLSRATMRGATSVKCPEPPAAEVLGHPEGITVRPTLAFEEDTFIPNDVLAAVLKIAGWKVTPPEQR